jgi:hypothetical protein
MITIGECADPEINARQIQSFPGTQFSTDYDPALHIVPVNAKNLKVNYPIIQIQTVTRFHNAGKR